MKRKVKVCIQDDVLELICDTAEIMQQNMVNYPEKNSFVLAI